jgi:hypothetical protein
MVLGDFLRNCPPNTWDTADVRLCSTHATIKDADVTKGKRPGLKITSKRKSCTKWYQPFHNAVHKQRSHKGIKLIEANQYALAHIWCATDNSVTFLWPKQDNERACWTTKWWRMALTMYDAARSQHLASRRNTRWPLSDFTSFIHYMGHDKLLKCCGSAPILGTARPHTASWVARA